jgi:protein O-GlcNAc transferase
MSCDELVQRAMALHQAGSVAEARAIYENVLTADPQHPDATHLLGLLLYQSGQLPEALPLLEKAVTLCPQAPHFYSNYGNALRANGQRTMAVEKYHSALRLNPKAPKYWLNLGNTQWELELLDEAQASLTEAIRLGPNLAEAHLGLGLVLKDLGLLDESEHTLARAVELNPDLVYAASARLYSLNYQAHYSPEQIYAEHRQWALAHADALTSAAPQPTNDRRPDRQLKVGYVSSYFRDHAISFFTEPILRCHDRSAFEIICYSDVLAPDEVTRRMQQYVDGWRSLVGLSDAAAAELIRRDQIDILVDLNGHIGQHRLLAFARRPAPVQISYLGYQATTGMAAMDYRLTDAFADPPSVSDAWHAEKLARIPKAFFCYQPPAESPPISPSPFAAKGVITFGSFSSFAKVTPNVLERWCQILRQVPDALLHLLVPPSETLRQRVLDFMRGQGIAADRMRFVARCPRRTYLEQLQSVDIALDPFPFNGHTTTCDALWMGVPVVSLYGKSYVQRYGSVALACLGLDDLIAPDEEAYVATAVRLAQDADRLVALRQSLRERMQRSVLLDGKDFTSRLEAVYRQLWQSWLRGDA